MRKLPVLIFIILLFGCSNEMADKERLTIIEDKSRMVYIESEDILAPQVCLENQQNKETVKPYLVTFELTKDLEAIVDQSYYEPIDSRSIFNGEINFPADVPFFCTGSNFIVTEEVTRNNLEAMMKEGAFTAIITELNGDVITSLPIEKLMIGKPEGTEVKP
ncbi:hypothetical protein F9U64_06495 [Gracilibacillus oryzae]|uniref:GerMN domain-containing protein n=1 Tax=Gracilibacillus oryzae TaxID=1672701 RepID=A0A7C8GU28_9BACI|nr:hypothetical protein [Gracilibacillus oryzae]KAB8138090.1 hypothetical protein F9U64_06495 [Gracilibacillus oryzae]